ncbi:MAG: translocation/assembly module TamB [Thermodesulfobacteriota bacterium]|nr:translocation/assembly module TamB [Thermodesulfobacteriota bacterium]
MNWKHIIKKMAQWVALGTGAGLLVFVIAIGLAQTGPAKKHIAKLVASRLSRPGERLVEVGKIKGLIPFSLDVNRIAFSDGDGEWLAVKDVTLRWSLLALLRGRIQITKLGAGSLRLHRLPLDGDDKDQGGPKGSVAWPGALGHVTIQGLAIEELALGEAVVGKNTRFRLEASMDGHGQSGGIAVYVHGAIHILEQTAPFLNALLGDGVDFSSHVTLAEAKGLTVQQFQIQTRAAQLAGSADLDLVEEHLEASCHLSVPTLAVLGPALGRGLEGTLQVDGKVQGPFAEPHLNLEAASQRLLLAGMLIQEIHASLKVEGWPTRGAGDLQVRVRHGEQPFGLVSDFAVEGPLLTLTTLSTKAGANTLTGNVALDLNRHTVKGELQGEFHRLSDLSPLIGEEIGGAAELTCKLDVKERGQDVIVAAQGKNLTSPYGEAASLALQARFAEPFENAEGTTNLELTGYRLNDLTLESLLLNASGNSHELNFSGSAKGHYQGGLDIQTAGVFRVTPEVKTLEFSQLDGHYGELPFMLSKPISVTSTEAGYTLNPLGLDLGSGHLECSGDFSDATFTLKGTMEALPVEALSLIGVPALSGTLDGTIHLHGPPEKPEGAVELRVREIARRGPPSQGVPRATLKAKAELGQDRLQTALMLRGLGDKPFEADLSIPFKLFLSPFAWAMPADGRLRGRLTGEIDLAWMPSAFLLDDQIMEGALDLSLTLDGTMGVPHMTGTGSVRNGAYEHLRSGTTLKEIDMAVTTENRRLSIRHARATDGGAGAISAEGWLELLSEKGFPFQLAMTLDQATLLRLDNATATAAGEVALSGTLAKASLSGNLQVPQAELRIPNRIPPEIVELDVIELHGESENGPALPAKKGEGAMNLDLNVEVNSPGRAFLRGRGLDSEWQGSLKITGSAGQPVMTGKLSVVRGHFDFMGKRFALQRGTLTLDASLPSSPYLDVLGESQAKDITARLQLSGSVLAPEVTLSSIPELPSDEILSRLLFGRGVAHITPMQALRLAHAARTLTAGGGFDFMGRARKMLGVDQLEVKQSGEDANEASISAGKYLRDGVYLEVEKGSGPESGKTSVEIEVTPNLTLETEIGENAEGGAGINWRKNY